MEGEASEKKMTEGENTPLTLGSSEASSEASSLASSEASNNSSSLASSEASSEASSLASSEASSLASSEASTPEEGKEILTTTPEEEAEAEAEEEDIGLQVGDTIFIRGGQLNKTRGKLYGFTPDRFVILPLGVSDRVITIPLIDGEPDPDLGIQEILLLKQATEPGFTILIDLHAGQRVETFDREGNPGPIYTVATVDTKKDSATFFDEEGEELTIDFAFTGIPRDLPFEVMRTRESPVAEQGAAATAAPAGAPQLSPAASGEVDDEDLEEGEEGEAAAEGELESPPIRIGEEIELNVGEEVEEIGSAERIFPDVFQRSEMLSQLIRDLPPAQQRDPIQLQKIRRMVERMMIMRNDVVQYGVTGEPRGLKQTSVLTLGELVRRPDVPMSRKVATMDKQLYLQHNPIENGAGNMPPQPDPPAGTEKAEGLIYGYNRDTVERAAELEELARAEPEGEVKLGLPKFYLQQERYRREIQTPYLLTPGKITVEKDEEVFRNEVPSLSEPALDVLAASAMGRLTEDYPVTQAPFAVARLLKKRQARFLEGEPIRTIEQGEAPAYNNVLIFPPSVLRDLGPLRSGNLAQDISLGMTMPTLLTQIFENLGDITDFPTAKNILSLGVKGNILGNVMLRDWLELLPMKLTGLGDSWVKLQGYGVGGLEWTTEQAEVLQEKVREYIASLRLFMIRQREENKATLANLKFEPHPLLLPEVADRLLARIQSQPLLLKLYEKVQEYMGELAKIDVFWFSFVFLKYPDLLLAAVGEQPDIVARERLRVVRDVYNESLAQAYKIKRRLAERGFPPRKNPCPHVESLEAVRKIGQARSDEPEDYTKMKLLLRFLNRYRGVTKDNWVDCNICKEHLLCAHELLQIQEFLRPKEQEVLHKELLLTFSGGSFAGKFICRNCGQPIADLDFDTNLEFDDEGRPMMGRSVMEDREQLAMDEQEELLKGPGEAEDELDFGTEELNTMYASIKKVTGLMGINPDEKDYRRMVADFSAYHSILPTPEQYAEATKGKKAQSYSIFYSIRYVTGLAAVILLNVQTHVPDYVVYYTSAECRDGFFGFPLEEQETIQHGIQCVSTVIAGINDNEFPWNLTTLQRSSDLVKRRDILIPIVLTQIKDMLKNPVQQLALQKKREYRIKLYGVVGGVKQDQVSKGFRPIPYNLSEEDVAEDAVTAGAAEPDKQAVAWIRQAHALAKKTAAGIHPESPYSQTTCCLHPIQAPGAFWSAQSLPALEPRVLDSAANHRSATLNTTFSTQREALLKGTLNPSEYYRLFTTFCYRGDNKGLPHELGLTLTCGRCGITFKENPNLPLTVDNNGEEREKGLASLKSNLQEQGVVIDDETFADLLEAVHQRQYVSKDTVPKIPRPENTFSQLAKLSFAPIDNWIPLLQRLQQNLDELGGSPTDVQLAEAARDLVDATKAQEELVRSKVGAQIFKVLEDLCQRNVREIGDVLTVYLTVPYERWVIGQPKYFILGSYELSPDTVKDILEKGMGPHLTPIGSSTALKGILLRKVKYFIKELSELCKKVFPLMRPLLTPGGQQILEYLLRAMIFGVIGHFVDDRFIPPIEADEDMDTGSAGGAGVNMRILLISLSQALTKYVRGSAVPTDEQIRIRLEERVEAEKQKFIKRLDKMSNDERRVELIKKKLGLGEWAVGGTKAIRQYDPSRYEAERVERAQSGLTDYPEFAAANAAEGGGRAFDMFGFVTAEAEGDGYDQEGNNEFDEGE